MKQIVAEVQGSELFQASQRWRNGSGDRIVLQRKSLEVGAITQARWDLTRKVVSR